MESKYIGQVFEGRWKVIALHKEKFTLENIYNERKIELFKTVFMNVVKGKTTISRVLCCRANKNKTPNRKSVKQVSIRIARRTTYAIRKERGTL